MAGTVEGSSHKARVLFTDNASVSSFNGSVRLYLVPMHTTY